MPTLLCRHLNDPPETWGVSSRTRRDAIGSKPKEWAGTKKERLRGKKISGEMCELATARPGSARTNGANFACQRQGEPGHKTRLIRAKNTKFIDARRELAQAFGYLQGAEQAGEQAGDAPGTTEGTRNRTRKQRYATTNKHVMSSRGSHLRHL